MQDGQRPGELIVPHSSDVPAPGSGSPEPERPTEQPAPQPVPTPAPMPEPQAAPVASTPATSAVPAPSVTEQQFTSTLQFAPAQPDDPAEQPLTWTAAEFVSHDKSPAWYGALTLGGVGAVAAIYLLTKDKITTVILLVVVALFGFAAARKPREQQYSLHHGGIQVGVRGHSFTEFKSFSVAEEAGITTITFMPLKRFMPPLTVYVTPQLEDEVVEFLSPYLPFVEHKADAVDGLMRRLRF